MEKRKIYRYTFPLETFRKQDWIIVPMHERSRFVAVEYWKGGVTVWAEVDVTLPVVNRIFHLRGTGHDLPTGKEGTPRHLGIAINNGFVWHLYVEDRPDGR